MEAQLEMLYSELRNIRIELIERIENGQGSILILPLIMDELRDVELTMKKIEKGTFGTCEISGELLPEELIAFVPLAKSIDDLSKIKSFYRKSFSY